MLLAPKFVALESQNGFSEARPRRSHYSAGFTLVEMVITTAVVVVMTAMALPVIQGSLQNYRMKSAVSGVTGAIQATRYRAIFQGCSSRISFSKANNTYQLSSQAGSGSCNTSFSNVGSATPFASSSISLGQDTTLQFNPGGSMSVVTGSNNLALTYGSLNETIQVSNYGSITVSP